MSPTLPPPGAPPEDLSLPTVLAGAKKNFAKSAMGNIASTVEALNPLNWGRAAHGLYDLGQGALSQAGIIDQGNPQAQAQHQAGLNALENMNWEHYGTVDNFLRTVRDDPATPISDAAAVASLLVGGEGIAARAPGAIEKGLLAAAVRAPNAATQTALLNAGIAGRMTARAVNRVVAPAAKVAQFADPTAAALTIARKAPGVISKIPGVGLATKAAGAVGGAGVGAALQHIIPIPGAGVLGGGYLGEKAAEGAMHLAGNPKVRAAVGNTVGAVARAAPIAGAVGRTQPMTPAEQGMQSGIQQAFGGPGGGQGGPAAQAGPGAQPGEPPPSTDPDDATLAQMAHDFGLGPAPAAAAAGPPQPSSGLQGAPPAVPGPVHAVVRQAEGGYHQPVGYTPGGGSTARGAYQMTDGTYAANLRKYHPEIVAQIGNSPAAIRAFRNTQQGWALNEPMGQQMVSDEIDQLKRQGLDPTADAVGTLHMLGNTRLLHADPNTPIEQVTGADQRRANAGIFRNVHVVRDFLNWMHNRNQSAAAQLQQRSAYAANGGRIERADGGNVVDMTEALMRRAEAHHKATQQDTKPLLSIPDETIAKALRVAQAGI